MSQSRFSYQVCSLNYFLGLQCLHIVVLTVNYVVQDGKSNWLEGLILMCKTCAKHDKTYSDTPQGLYVILALTFWFYPGNSGKSVPYPAQYIANCKQLPRRNLHKDSFVDEFSDLYHIGVRHY